MATHDYTLIDGQAIKQWYFMNPELPVLVVDDARFSSAVISRTLRQAGYRNVDVVNSAPQALEHLEQRPASILIADWLMPEMDGLELTDSVRQRDEQKNHYTYVILLTARESLEALSSAFDRGVDDFIYKSDMTKQLLPRVYAADRISNRQNTLLDANELLLQENRQLEAHSIIDPETGLGNRQFARRRLQQALDYTESRGGATGYLVIGIQNWQSRKQENPDAVICEILGGVARRLTSLIRPLDALCRIAEDQFAVIAHFPDEHSCRPAAFRRLHDGINHKAFKTGRGFVSLEVATTLCIAIGNEGPPSVEAMEAVAADGLKSACETRTLTRARVTTGPAG